MEIEYLNVSGREIGDDSVTPLAPAPGDTQLTHHCRETASNSAQSKSTTASLGLWLWTTNYCTPIGSARATCGADDTTISLLSSWKLTTAIWCPDGCRQTAAHMLSQSSLFSVGHHHTGRYFQMGSRCHCHLLVHITLKHIKITYATTSENTACWINHNSWYICVIEESSTLWVMCLFPS